MILDRAIHGYEAGAELRDVTLREARAMECNRCGDCCDGLSEYVRTDDSTGLPLMTWGSRFPEDLYQSRYARRMLQPIGFVDGGVGLSDAFETDADGEPYTAFQCAFLQRIDADEAVCQLYDAEIDPSDLSTMRPRNCGDFPVFGIQVDDALIAGHTFVPATGSLPRCTWYGIRIVGPWRDSPAWADRWERQQRGEDVAAFTLPHEFVRAIARRKATTNGK